MVYIMFAGLMLVLLETAAVLGVMLWRLLGGGTNAGRDKTRRAGGGADAPEVGLEGESDTSEDFEKHWREGLNAMMGYDLDAARKAVRSDGGEEI